MAVVSATEATELTDGTNVIVNAAKGEITVEPSEEEITAAEAAKSRAAAAKGTAWQPGATKGPPHSAVGECGQTVRCHRIGIWCRGRGPIPYRFLFIGNAEPPASKKQTKAYIELLSQFPGKKVVIRMPTPAPTNHCRS